MFFVRADTREEIMTDDKSSRGSGDRSRVAGGEGYEVDYFAKKHGISTEGAMRLIKEYGNDRAKLDEAASRLNRTAPEVQD
jgi:hypothetical protein